MSFSLHTSSQTKVLPKTPKNRLIIWLLSAIIISGCSEKESSKNEKELTNFLVEFKESNSFIPLNKIPGVQLDAELCILEPYQDRISNKERKSLEINKKLAEISYISGESHWAIIQYKNSGALSVSKIYQSQRRLNFEAIAEMRKGGMCGSPKKFKATTAADGSIIFVKEGE